MSRRVAADLVVDRVGGLPVGDPGDDAGVALLADEREGALVGAEAGVLVSLRPLVVRSPVAQAAHAAGAQFARASASHARVDLHALQFS